MSDKSERFYNGLNAAGGNSTKKIAAGGSYTLTKQELDVEVDLASCVADVVLTLPDAQLCKGDFASVMCRTANATYDVTVAGPGVGTDYASTDMDGALDVIVLYSNGFSWIAVHTDIAH